MTGLLQDCHNDLELAAGAARLSAGNMSADGTRLRAVNPITWPPVVGQQAGRPKPQRLLTPDRDGAGRAKPLGRIGTDFKADREATRNACPINKWWLGPHCSSAWRS